MAITNLREQKPYRIGMYNSGTEMDELEWQNQIIQHSILIWLMVSGGWMQSSNESIRWRLEAVPEVMQAKLPIKEETLNKKILIFLIQLRITIVFKSWARNFQFL